MALSNRAPVARNPMRLGAEMAASALQRPKTTTELLMTSVPPTEDQLVAHISGIFAGRVPLRTLSVGHWPAMAEHLQCLHCGGPCDAGPPVPAARTYDTQNDTYWVYGPFCRCSCALGYICENDSTSKQLAPTVELMRRFFGLKALHVAPPRQAHVRFGGPLGPADFYGHSGYTTITTAQPPFVTFANYVMGVHLGAGVGPGGPAGLNDAKKSITTLLPQSAGRLVDLQRPEIRLMPIAEKKSTGKGPLILEFLAGLTSLSDVKDASEAVEVKEAKKRARTTEATVGPTNFLKQYVKK